MEYKVIMHIKTHLTTEEINGIQWRIREVFNKEEVLLVCGNEIDIYIIETNK